MLSLAAQRCSQLQQEAGRQALRRAISTQKRRLLAVVLQHLIAGRRYLRAILLQTGEDRKIALVDDAAAMTLDVTVAGCLLLRRAGARLLRGLLGESRRGQRDKSESQNKLAHVILHFDGSNPAPAERRFGCRHGLVRWLKPRNAATKRAQAWQMRLN